MKFRLAPGLQPLDPDDWLVLDTDHDALLAERRHPFQHSGIRSLEFT